MSGKRRKYTPEFREQAARLVIETGRPVAHVAAEIGVGEQVLGRWVRLQRQAASAGDTAIPCNRRDFVLWDLVGERRAVGRAGPLLLLPESSALPARDRRADLDREGTAAP